MRQDVNIVGADLSKLVPFSLPFRDANYAVTLAPSEDVIARAMSLADGRSGWLLVILTGAETAEACAALYNKAPLGLFVTPVEHEPLRRTLYALDLPVINEAEGPLVALASLVATARWLASTSSQNSLSEPGQLTPGSAS
jgi:hypothetical protein